MRSLQFLVAGLLSLSQFAACAPAAAPLGSECEEPTRVIERAVPSTTFNNKVIFSPPSNAGWTDPRTLYPRIIQLSSGVLLATWENYSPEPPIVYYPIYRSQDGGLTWSEIGRVRDTVNGWGNRYQPFLYQLPQAIGNYPAGTVLLAGNALPTDLSKTKIDVYASRDGGFNWEFVSSVAQGGEGRPINGLTPVWEPFLMVYQNQLICYYADQRDPKHGQKLAHQVTSDLRTWSAVVNDVADTNNYEARPGMPVVTRLPNGQYIFVYEVCGTDGCRLHYRLTSNPLRVNAAPALTLVSNLGTRPVSSPYVVWSKRGGANGTIIVSSGTSSAIYTNKQLGAENAWVEYNTAGPRGYSRSLMLFREDDNYLAIFGAGRLPPSSVNQVELTVLKLSDLGI